MCVIAAKKVKLKNSDVENWFLYKVRDRNYDPEYKLEVEDKKWYQYKGWYAKTKDKLFA